MNDVTFSGPFFDSRESDSLGSKMVHDVEHDIATRGISEVKHRLHDVLRHPHTDYEDQHIREDTQINDVSIIDSNQLYGPWLEGTGSRNTPKTRFPGYFTFRIVSQQLDHDSSDIAQNAVDSYIVGINS